MGLYDDDNAAVTGGDLNNGDYWWAKLFSIGLEEALKTKQPEHKLKGYLEKTVAACDKVLKTYPEHADVKQWKEKAVALQGKINKAAPYADWSPQFPYGHGTSACDGFMKGWVNLHWARFAKEKEDWKTAFEQGRACTSNLGPTEAQRGMSKWSAEIQKFITDGFQEATDIMKHAMPKK